MCIRPITRVPRGLGVVTASFHELTLHLHRLANQIISCLDSTLQTDSPWSVSLFSLCTRSLAQETVEVLSRLSYRNGFLSGLRPVLS